MTSPEDDGLEEALRRALSDAASEVEPGADGLDKIRARIGDRPPRPWLLSVLSGLVDRVRHWTWRGHWAWQDSLPRAQRLSGSADHDGATFRDRDIGWLRFVTVLAGVAVLAGIALGVQPFRHAILQASSSLNGGGGPPRGRRGNRGQRDAGHAGGGTPTAGTVAQVAGRPASPRHRGSEVARPRRRTRPRAPGARPPRATGRGRPRSRARQAVARQTAGISVPRVGTAPAARALAPLSASSATPAQPVYTSTSVPTCPVARPTRTPTADTDQLLGVTGPHAI